jgi:hypothetical protein
MASEFSDWGFSKLMQEVYSEQNYQNSCDYLNLKSFFLSSFNLFIKNDVVV